MSQQLPKWLSELLDEYPLATDSTSKQFRSRSSLARLVSAFLHVPSEVMSAAVVEYMKENQYFPKLSDLNPYVLEAEKVYHPTARPYDDWERIASIQNMSDDDKEHLDSVMLRWEQQRGTMPATEKIGSEWLA